MITLPRRRTQGLAGRASAIGPVRLLMVVPVKCSNDLFCRPDRPASCATFFQTHPEQKHAASEKHQPHQPEKWVVIPRDRGRARPSTPYAET